MVRFCSNTLFLIFVTISFSRDLSSVILPEKNCDNYLINFEEIKIKVKRMVENFSSDHPIPEPIDFKSLEMNDVTDRSSTLGVMNLDDNGEDGDLRFGKYHTYNVVVKFFKKNNFIASYPEIIIGDREYMGKIWQGYFILKVNNELKLGPRPYGYLVGKRASEYATSVGLDGEKYYGMIVMEQIRAKFHYKKNFRPSDEEVRYSELYKKNTQLVESVGLKIVDKDYMIDIADMFYFMDVDYWKIKNNSGQWSQGFFKLDSCHPYYP